MMEVLPLQKQKRKRKSINNEFKLKKLKTTEEDKERLEKLVLGDGSSIIRNIARLLDNDSGLEDSDSDDDKESQFSDTLASPPRQPAWHDEDDDINLTTGEAYVAQGCRQEPVVGVLSENYQHHLRKRFKTVFGEPVWAKLPKHKTYSSEDDDELSLLTTCGNLIKKPQELPRSLIDAKLVASLNSQTRNEGPIIKSVEFHPTSTVALVAGLSGVASIFQVDGQINSKLTSIQFDRFPIRCAKFTRDGNKFIVGSNLHSHFHVYDMIEGREIKVPIHHNMEQTNMKSFAISPDGKLIAVRGRFGAIHLLTTASHEWVGNLQMNGNVSAIAFNSDGSTLYSHGECGEMWVWDMRRRVCSSKVWDEGCVSGTCLAVSPNDRLLASGSSSGVVTVYSTSSLSSPTPTPLKALMNLVTPATFLSFDSSSQLLLYGSDEKDNAVKLCHIPSMTTYSNFPSFNTALSRVQCGSFSPNSGYLSFGNNKSTAFLYRLKYFGNY